MELYDAILSGSNAELTVRSTLQRAAGYIQYNTHGVTGVPQKFYTFQPTSRQGQVFPIVDTTTGVYYVPPGTTVPTTIVTKTQGTQSSFFGVGSYLYIGNNGFSKKWDTGTPQGTTNWGIAIGSVNNAVSAYCGTGSIVGGSGSQWSSPTNIQGAPDGVDTSVSLTAAAHVFVQSDGLNATNYGFTIPNTSTINGLLVTLTGSGSTLIGSLNVYLQNGGITIGSYKIATPPQGSDASFTVGSSSDTWGITLTPSIVNSSSFGLQIYANLYGGVSGQSETFQLDSAQITVYGTGGPSVATVAGTLTATQGFQYVFCYGNSNDSNISNPTPPSVNIKPVAQGVQVSLTASTDPQVNQIRVFRTTDTGTGAVFFELPTSPYPNTTQNVVDNAIDTALQVNQAVVLGSLAFSPPPAGLVNMEWYAGRLWGSVGNLLYFSAGPDNFPMGKGTSNWPPGNVFELPTNIVKNVALNGGNGLLVITVDGIHVVQGISNPGFTVNKWLSDVGARWQNAVDTDGSNIYMYTSDNQFLRISAQGIDELSQTISDQTDSLDATKVYVCQHRSGSQDSRVFLTDGSTKIFPYNLMLGAWEPVRTPVDGGGVGAIGSIEISPGTWKFLKGATAGGQVILQRDLGTFSDNGIAYTWNVIFGNIPLADPTQLANVESIVGRFANVGNIPTCSILPNDIAGSFITITRSVQEPPEANSPPTGYLSRKYYIGDSSAWSQMTHLQVQFSFIAEPLQNEIFSFGIFPNESADEPVGAIPQIQGR